MSRNIIAGLMITLLFVLLGGCSEQEGEEELVDQQYLESENYSEFEQNSNEEILFNEENKRNFPGYLSLLNDCQQARQLTPPFTLTSDKLIKMQENISAPCTAESHQKPAYSLHAVARSELGGDLSLYLVILDRPSVYRNQGIFAATFREDSLLNYSSVGSVEKDLSKEITTDIKVDQTENQELQITSSTNSHIIYPFEQENQTEERFIINSEGEITIQG